MKCCPKYRKAQTEKRFHPERWIWQSAHTDCSANHNILPAYIFELLAGYMEHDPSSLQKLYETEQEAMGALRKVLDRMEKDLDGYKRRLTC
jgi:hypothetical protein